MEEYTWEIRHNSMIIPFKATEVNAIQLHNLANDACYTLTDLYRLEENGTFENFFDH